MTSIPSIKLIYCQGRVIGEVTPTGVFKKCIKPTHLLKTPAAICYDQDVLDQARLAGATSLLVITEDGVKYETSLSFFDEHCFSVNRGFGEQRAMRINLWTVNGVAPILKAKRKPGLQLLLGL